MTAAEPDTLLVERARDFLAAGPADATTLVSSVCQLPGAPTPVAEHLARTLLGAHPGFALGTDGRWRLSAATHVDAAGAAAGAGTAAAATTGGAAGGIAHRRLLDERFVVVDVETTGGRALNGDRVTEIAAVVVEQGVVGEVYATLVNPQRPIPPWITSITNITWDMVRDAPSFADVCGDVTAMLDGRVFVAHNAQFDWSFVGAEVARASGRQLEGRRLCTVRLARKLLPQLPRRSLDMVANHYGVEIAVRHRAAGDAVATAHVLLRLLRDAADRGFETWAQLDTLFATPTTGRRRRRPSGFPQPARGEEGA
ncbi:MAG: 3'-5' exonuclease [Gemmatimonadaceae bacterium]